MTTLGMPFFLADKTGSVFGSDFTDLYGRMSLRVTCTQRNNQRIAYMVYRLDDSSTYVNNVNRPQAALDFGPNHALGTVSIGPKPHIPMEQYLTKASMTGPLSRKFIAADGQVYRWSWRKTATDEWTCVNERGYLIAGYHPKVAGEPPYDGTSGCMLTIEEPYPHLACELLASLTIMRHIAAKGNSS